MISENGSKRSYMFLQINSSYTSASQYIRMLLKSSFISVIQLKLWNLSIK